MKKKRKTQEDLLTAAETAWGLFSETGHVAYYSLYKKLKGEE